MPDDDDLTPPDGFQTEQPTQPASAHVTCPACAGQQRILRTEEHGSGYRAIMKRCPLCGATGQVTKDQYEEWIAKRRP